jgi:hypothetical protein
MYDVRSTMYDLIYIVHLTSKIEIYGKRINQSQAA